MQIRFMPAFGGKPPKRKKAIEKRREKTTRTQTEAEKMASKIGSLSCRANKEEEKKHEKKINMLCAIMLFAIGQRRGHIN